MDAARRFFLPMGLVCLLAGAAWAAGDGPGAKPPTDAEPAVEPRDCSAPPAPVEAAPEDDPVATAMAHYARGRTLMLRGSHALAARELERAAALAPHVGRIWLRLGEAFFDAGNLDRAVEGLDRALEIDPADPEALCLRGRAAQGLDRTEEALRHFEKLLATASADSAYPILARYYLARLHQQDQNIGGAIEHFAALLDLLEQPSIGFRQHPEVFMLYRRKDQLRQILARLYLLRRDNEKAVGVLRDDVDSLPEDRELLNLLYHAHTRAGEHEQARQVARKLISLAPRKATGYQRLIQTYAAEDRPEGAAAELEQIRKEDPENHVAAFHLAAVYESLGRPEEARAIYREFANRPDPLTHADATAAIKLAEIHVAEDKPVEAIELLARAFSGRPGESSLLIRSARLIDGLENPAEVYEEARRLVEDEETRFGAFLLVGMLAERVRRSEDAIDLYEKAIAREPKAAIAYSRKGDLLIQAGREDDALATYRQAFEAGLELPMFHRKMGMVLERLNRLEEALEQYREARAGAPHDKPTRYLLTSVLLRLGRLDEAEESLKTLLSDFPGDTEAQYQLAGLNLVRGRVEEAEKLVREALEADPGAARGKALLAEIRYRQGRFAEAERLASEVLQAEPGSAETRLLMAHAMAQQGDYRDAISEVRALLAADPENIRYRYILSGLHQQRGDQEAAEGELLVILGRNPDHAPANNDLGYLWADRGVNLDRAERMIRAALEVDPERPAYLDSLGWVLYKRQRFEAAVEVLGRATDMAPDLDFVLWDHLGDAYWRMRRRGEATDAWKRAAELLEDSKAGDGEDLRRVRDKLEDAASGEPPKVAPVGESPEPDTTRGADAGS
jgi:tetratricopeptide (TPR) repeat protein